VSFVSFEGYVRLNPGQTVVEFVSTLVILAYLFSPVVLDIVSALERSVALTD